MHRMGAYGGKEQQGKSMLVIFGSNGRCVVAGGSFIDRHFLFPGGMTEKVKMACATACLFVS